MWGPRYFARRFFPLRYFPAGGEGVAADPTPRVIPMTGSYVIAPALTGSYVISASMTGSYVPSPAMTGSVSDG